MELEPEVRLWLEQLSAEQFAAAAFCIDVLAEYGPLLGEPYTRQLASFGNSGSISGGRLSG